MARTRHTASVPLEYVQDATPGGTPERLLEIKDEIRLMHEIINSLPTLQRTIMRMKDIKGSTKRKRSPTSQAVIRKPSEVTCRERERK